MRERAQHGAALGGHLAFGRWSLKIPH
jgi:hypothetical protein